MKTLLKRINPKKAAIVLGAIMLLLVLNRIISNNGAEEEIIPEEKIKAVEVIEFGYWTPDSRREITGTFLSGTDVDIQAEVSGTIAETYVFIGETVKKGQPLATFQRQNDATQISYENLLQQLAVAKAQTAASVQSAETTLETAKRNREQTATSEAQTYSKTFDLLRTYSRNAETTFSDAVALADLVFGVSNTAKSNISSSYFFVGNNDYKTRQAGKNETGRLLREDARIGSEYIPNNISDSEVLEIATDRLTLLKDAQNLLRTISFLAFNTPVTDSFPDATKIAIQTENSTYLASLETLVYSLETQIQAAKSEQGRNKLSLVGVDNAVQKAEAALEVAKAQAQAQIISLETQIRLARNSQEDLTVRAPFTGKITGKNIVPYDQVKAGQVLFSIVGEDVKPKIETTITADELQRVMANSEDVKAVLDNGEMISLPEFKVSGKLNASTQKVTLNFPLQEMPERVLVGSFVKVLLPIDGKQSNLLPISAISFEPDGAETLVLENGIGKRVKIEAGKLVSNAIEIIGGLEEGTSVVRYRSRAHAGEKLEALN